MSKNMVGTNNIGTKTIGTKIFWSKHILSSKDMLEPKRSGVKKEILGQKKLGRTKYWGKKNVWSNKNVCQQQQGVLVYLEKEEEFPGLVTLVEVVQLVQDGGVVEDELQDSMLGQSSELNRYMKCFNIHYTTR